MSRYSELFSAGMDVLASYTGETAIYVANGSRKVCTIIAGKIRTRYRDADRGKQRVRELEATLDRASVPDPSMKGMVEFAGLVWPIDDILGQTTTHTRLLLCRVETEEISSQHYRR